MLLMAGARAGPVRSCVSRRRRRKKKVIHTRRGFFSHSCCRSFFSNFLPRKAVTKKGSSCSRGPLGGFSRFYIACVQYRAVAPTRSLCLSCASGAQYTETIGPGRARRPVPARRKQLAHHQLKELMESTLHTVANTVHREHHRFGATCKFVDGSAACH